MKWRDVFIGSLATLVVTVVGGVILYYLTREASVPEPQETLVFKIDDPVIFESDETTLSFVNVRVKNVGNKAAKDVTVGVQFDDQVKITDHRASLSSGPAGKIESNVSGLSIVNATVAILTPDETATVAILTDSAEDISPTVAVKSIASVGAAGSFTKLPELEGSTKPTASEVGAIVVPLALFGQIVLLIFLRPRLRKALRQVLPGSRSVNNTAFVLLHGGLTKKALELLSRAVNKTGADPHTLANYGLALGLSGDDTEANSCLDAAEFWADVNKHELALVAFNRSILAFKSDKQAVAIEFMKSALSMSTSEIVRYSRYSKVITELRLESEALDGLLIENGLEQTGQITKP